MANPAHPTKDGATDVHELFLSNFFAQTAALAFGKTADEVRAEGTDEAIVPARVFFAGDRPTTSIMAPELSRRCLVSSLPFTSTSLLCRVPSGVSTLLTSGVSN